jgi:hypothetical protein
MLVVLNTVVSNSSKYTCKKAVSKDLCMLFHLIFLIVETVAKHVFFGELIYLSFSAVLPQQLLLTLFSNSRLADDVCGCELLCSSSI